MEQQIQSRNLTQIQRIVFFLVVLYLCLYSLDITLKCFCSPATELAVSLSRNFTSVDNIHSVSTPSPITPTTPRNRHPEYDELTY